MTTRWKMLGYGREPDASVHAARMVIDSLVDAPSIGIAEVIRTGEAGGRRTAKAARHYLDGKPSTSARFCAGHVTSRRPSEVRPLLTSCSAVDAIGPGGSRPQQRR